MIHLFGAYLIRGLRSQPGIGNGFYRNPILISMKVQSGMQAFMAEGNVEEKTATEKAFDVELTARWTLKFSPLLL